MFDHSSLRKSQICMHLIFAKFKSSCWKNGWLTLPNAKPRIWMRRSTRIWTQRLSQSIAKRTKRWSNGFTILCAVGRRRMRFACWCRIFSPMGEFTLLIIYCLFSVIIVGVVQCFCYNILKYIIYINIVFCGGYHYSLLDFFKLTESAHL